MEKNRWHKIKKRFGSLTFFECGHIVGKKWDNPNCPICAELLESWKTLDEDRKFLQDRAHDYCVRMEKAEKELAFERSEAKKWWDAHKIESTLRLVAEANLAVACQALSTISCMTTWQNMWNVAKEALSRIRGKDADR